MQNNIFVVILCIDLIKQVCKSADADEKSANAGGKPEKGKEIAVKKHRTMNIVVNEFMDAAVAVVVIAASSRRSP